MKQLSSTDPQRQQLFEHDHRTYSIVDLTLAPLEADGSRVNDAPFSNFAELMEKHYGEHHFELAEETKRLDTLSRLAGFRVIDRYKSFEDARAAIEMTSKEVVK